ncbi:N-acetylmuramoyl-L-alanine amidase [Neobacillus niacini]|uniref:N-acetylmuramoyl-L-alanine amidase n=1 Tax=Neobacillus driksii TaxID=3035913 RepID=UPI0027822B1C|nr:N-acetylmuramoyl-L-alanine amidase [Neobacillus niacini]MDQ0976602.1 N-acetylmuramoyl-L-alanine amidase [Neobacillus niacini]
MTYKIAICAGHGYNTSGKRTPDDEREWAFNDKVADAFMSEMSKYAGVEVKRFDDVTGKTDVSLSARVKGAKTWGADVYISFHHNANTGKWGNWTGTQVHVYKTKPSGSDRLAKLVNPEIVKAYGLRDRGIIYNDLYITRETHCDAILIEGGFMDSTIDIKKLRNNTVLANAGKGVAKAVAKFGGLKLKPVPVPKPVPKPVPVSSGKTHKVVAGDTLYSISRKYGISVDKIKAYNGMKDTVLSIGEVIKLSAVKTHKIVNGDTLWGLSRKYSLSVAEIKSINGLKSDVLTIGDVLTVSK